MLCLIRPGQNRQHVLNQLSLKSGQKGDINNVREKINSFITEELKVHD